MRITTITSAAGLALLPASGAWAAPPNMTCSATSSVASGATAADRVQTIVPTTDVFRFKDGKLHHRWSGRAEYLYGSVVELADGRFMSGHMLVVLADGGGRQGQDRKGQDRKGYVVIAGPDDWRVVYVDCKS